MYINLLSNSIHGYKEKEKKTPEFRDNNIPNYRLGVKGKKIFWENFLKKAKFVTPVEKKSRDMQSVGQKNKNPP